MKNKSNKPKRHKDWIYFDNKTGIKILHLSQILGVPFIEVINLINDIGFTALSGGQDARIKLKNMQNTILEKVKKLQTTHSKSPQLTSRRLGGE